MSLQIHSRKVHTQTCFGQIVYSPLRLREIKKDETERDAEDMIESTSDKMPQSSIDRRFELMALINPWESERLWLGA